MAYITVKYRSKALCRPVSFDVFMPNDPDTLLPWEQGSEGGGRLKTLFLLHGYSESGFNWVPEQLAARYGFAVVIPSGENSFWLDGEATGSKFCTFVGEELPDYVNRTFGLAGSRADTFVLGLSMGGFGALHTALTYPARFGKVGAMSSALIVHEVAGMTEDAGNGIANYAYYRECFGEPSKVLESKNNPEALIDKLLADRVRLPEIYMCCGTEDFLLENNREFHRFLESRGVAHIYKESAGAHDMRFWSEYIEKIADWMFG